MEFILFFFLFLLFSHNLYNIALANTIESYHHIKLDLEEGLKRRIFNESHSTRITAADIMRSLNALIKEHGSKQYQTVLGVTLPQIHYQ